MKNIFEMFYDKEEANVKHLKTQLLMLIIKEYRKNTVTQRVLAEKLGVSCPRVCVLLKGDLQDFSLEMLHRFCIRMGLEGLATKGVDDSGSES